MIHARHDDSRGYQDEGGDLVDKLKVGLFTCEVVSTMRALIAVETRNHMNRSVECFRVVRKKGQTKLSVSGDSPRRVNDRSTRGVHEMKLPSDRRRLTIQHLS